MIPRRLLVGETAPEVKSDILRTFLVSQYGQWREYKAMDKTALRKILYGRIDRIVELDKRHPK